jgi:hypothetical protein
MSKKEYEKHPAYGMISLHNTSVSPSTDLFGSKVKHNSYVSLTISTAEVSRDLNTDWYYSDKVICRVALSKLQLSELLFSVGGEGVPCTLENYRDPDNGEWVPFQKCPGEPKAQLAYEEFKKKASEATKPLDSAEDFIAEAIKKGRMGKMDLEKLLNMVGSAKMGVEQNLPYVAKCFDEHVEKTVTEAKSIIESFADSKKKGLSTSVRKMLEGKVDDE